MRLALISDIHANLEALRATLAAIRQDAPDAILCLGDIVGYHADPEACVDLLDAAGALCVAGNHDRAVTGRIGTDGFSPVAARAVAWTRRRLSPAALDWLAALPLRRTIGDADTGRALVAVHGALHPGDGCELTRLDTDAKRLLTAAALDRHPGASVCAYGHTHRLGVHAVGPGSAATVRELAGDSVRFQDGARHLLNPGSVGQPRTAETRATFMLLDLDRGTVVIRRVGYDAAAALAKARRAGLIRRPWPLPEPVKALLRPLRDKVLG